MLIRQPPLEKLPYKKSKEESKAVAQKDLDNWRKSLVESKARRLHYYRKAIYHRDLHQWF
jgi:hypothetical protein